jgi:hypothetical protein
MIHVYIAAAFDQRDVIKDEAGQYIEAGLKVTSRWLFEHHESNEPPGSDKRHEEDQHFAMEDMNDLFDADVVVSYTQPTMKMPDGKRLSFGSGGRHVEFGMAYAWGKKLIIIGPHEPVFHHLPGVLQLDSTQSAIDYIKTLVSQTTLIHPQNA